MGRIFAELNQRGAENRRAHFVSALVLAWPDGHTELFEGRVFGEVVEPRGSAGFGYDPLFKPDGHERTFGEMRPTRSTASTGRRVPDSPTGAGLRDPGTGMPGAGGALILAVGATLIAAALATTV